MFPHDQRGWAKLAILTGLLLIIFACLRLAGRTSNSPSAEISNNTATPSLLPPTSPPSPMATTQPTETPEPTETLVPTPSDPAEQLLYNIEHALGDNNRDVPRIGEYWFNADSGLIYVQFAIDDNLGIRMIRTGARIDTLTILEEVSQTSLDYSGVDVLGTFELVDQYGNTSESIVTSLYYTRETVERINFDNMLFENVYEIADNVGMIHLEFRD